MYQSSWPGFPARSIDPIALPAEGGAIAPRSALPIPAPGGADGVATPWYASPPAAGGASAFGASPFGPAGLGFGLLAQLQSMLGMLQQAIASALQGMGSTVPGTGSGSTTAGTQRFLQDADLSSTGDPHLAETGTTGTGAAIDKHLDSMTAHGDLIDAHVAGGYRVSTQVTAPAAGGVTYNSSATITTGNGSDCVSMDASGAIAISENGQAVSISKGQSRTLAGGAMVTENSDGSLVVTATSSDGGSIATTLRTNGRGVDVAAHAHHLAVGGDIADS